MTSTALVISSKNNNNRTQPKVATSITVQQPKQTNNQPKKKKKRKGKKKGNPQSLIRKYFLLSAYPSVTGPIRQPRMGGSDRTGLGYDISVYTFVGDATNTVKGLQMGTTYSTNSSGKWEVALATTNFGSATLLGISSQFPATANLADVNLVSADLSVYYSGNALNASGELIIGSCLPISGSSNYNAMYLYPGTRVFTINSLLDKVQTVCLRKLSPVADEFVPTTTGNADVDLPFVFASGLPTGGTLVVKMTRAWEYRSTTVTSNIVPYEKTGDSHSRDVLAYQDSRADLASQSSTLLDPTSWAGSAMRMLGIGGNVATAGISLANMLTNHHANRMRGGANQPAIEMRDWV